MGAETIYPCTACGKRTNDECSHVECSNRRPVTARQIGDPVSTRGATAEGRTLAGVAIVRRPRYFED